MPYKNIKKQRKFARLWMRSKRAGKPWKGMEKIGTERVKRKSRMLPLGKRNSRKKWLHKPAAKKRGSEIRGNF